MCNVNFVILYYNVLLLYLCSIILSINVYIKSKWLIFLLYIYIIYVYIFLFVLINKSF